MLSFRCNTSLYNNVAITTRFFCSPIGPRRMAESNWAACGVDVENTQPGITSTGVSSFLTLLWMKIYSLIQNASKDRVQYSTTVKERAMYFLILRICTGTTALFRSPPAKAIGRRRNVFCFRSTAASSKVTVWYV